jgi:hypothetical protein
VEPVAGELVGRDFVSEVAGLCAIEEDTRMTDHSSYPDTDDDTGVGPDRIAPGMPRWLRVSGIIVGLIIVLVVGISFIAGAGHGPEQFGPGIHAPER